MSRLCGIPSKSSYLNATDHAFTFTAGQLIHLRALSNENYEFARTDVRNFRGSYVVAYCTWAACPCISVFPSLDVDDNRRLRVNASLDSSRLPATPRILIVARGRKSKSSRTLIHLFEKSPFAVTSFLPWACFRTILSARSRHSLSRILIFVYIKKRELLVSIKVKIIYSLYHVITHVILHYQQC